MSATALLTRRAVREGARNVGPAFIVPLIPTIILLVVMSSLFGRIDESPDFGDGSYINWVDPAAVMLPAFMAAGFTTVGLVRDAQTGYLDRLRLLPISPFSALSGRIFFEAIRIVPATLIVMAVAVALGTDLATGIAGVVVLVVLEVLIAVAYNGLFFAAALRTLNPQISISLQPLQVPITFLSSAWVPVALMPAWAGTIARYNPVSVIFDGARSAMTDSVASSEVAAAFALVVVAIVVMYAAVFAQYRNLVRSH